MLEELGLEYECHPIQSRTGETHTDEFKRLNPRHKIPVLRHGSFVLTESAAIISTSAKLFQIPQRYTGRLTPRVGPDCTSGAISSCPNSTRGRCTWSGVTTD